MNVRLVIDAIVRQTTVLIAQLATSAGMRAPLAHIANQTFLSLVGELERQGIGQKVIADMFGLALRSYQQKVQRLSESVTDRGVSLWEAMHGFLQERQVVSRAEVLRRFARDDQASVRGILNDLVDSGLVYKTGRADGTVYRVAPAEDMEKLEPAEPGDAITALVWVTVYREGPLASAALAELLGLDSSAVQRALGELEQDGRVRRIDVDDAADAQHYTSERCFIALGESAGWEAALLDHYQAVVRAICAKLGQGQTSATASDRIGGSTYSFDVWPGHPHAEEVYGLLSELRDRVSRLWDTVGEHNLSSRVPGDADRVTLYFGQWVQTDDTSADTLR
ncbi:MAG: hypothetical protein OEZ06_04945 [Myxococcales bacterium]|nr:hypothetical protein [Myxococcales bacterium]